MTHDPERLRALATRGDLEAASDWLRSARRSGTLDAMLPAEVAQALARRARDHGDLQLELDALVVAPPSPETWLQLWQRAATLDAPSLDALESLLDARWPDALRPLPEEALRELVDLEADVRGRGDHARRPPRTEPRWRLARRLAPSPWGRELHFGGSALRRACACQELAGIRELNLASQNAYLGGVPGAWLMPLTEPTSSLRALHSLNLDLTRLSDRGLEPLCRAESLASVRALSLATNAITARGLRRLVESPLGLELEALTLDGNRLGADACNTLVDADGLSRLAVLALGGNPLGSSGLRVLASATHWTLLRTLILSATGAERHGLAALAQAPWLRQLERLALGTVQLDPATLAILCDALQGGPLRELELPMCNLGTRAIRRLAATELPALRRLCLGGNPIDAEAIRHLLAAPWAPQLESLDLQLTTLGPEALSRIATSQRLGALEHFVSSDLQSGTSTEPRLMMLRSTSLPLRLRHRLLEEAGPWQLWTIARALGLQQTGERHDEMLRRVKEALP